MNSASTYSLLHEPNDFDLLNGFVNTDGVIYSSDKKRVLKGVDATEVTVLDSCEVICDGAFRGCANLERIKLPNGLRMIGKVAFIYCHHLLHICLPDSIIYVGPGAFRECSWVNFSGSFSSSDRKCLIINGTLIHASLLDRNYTLPLGVKVIGDYALEKQMIEYIELPEGLLDIRDHAFFNCKYLDGVRLPNSVTNIGASSFGACEGLHSIYMSSNVTSIGDYAFAGTRLSTLTLPDAIQAIGNNAIDDCPVLESLIIFAPSPPIIGKLFNVINTTFKIYVPYKSLDLYKDDENWNNYKTMINPWRGIGR